MSRILDFLNTLDDHELAFLARYKKDSYMKPTREIISEYLLKRNLSASKIDHLIANNPKSKLNDERERCPRCYSDKIRKDKVEWTNTGGGIGLDDEIATWDGVGGRVTYKNEVICNVCGYWLIDPNQEKPLPTKRKVLYGIWDFLLAVFRGL